MKKLILVLCLSLIGAGCSKSYDESIASAIRDLVPKTETRILSISDLPEKIKESFVEYLNPYKDFDLEQLALQLPPERIELIKKELADRSWVAYTIKDRNQKYFGGCTGGDIHFLEGGITKHKVWILYESGGIAGDTANVLVFISKSEHPTLIRHCWIDFEGNLHDIKIEDANQAVDTTAVSAPR